MPVTKRTPNQLNIRSVFLTNIGASLRFDRPRREVAMIWLAGIIPFRRTVLPMDEIARAQVRKTERSDGRTTYSVVLRRKRRAGDLKFECPSRVEAMTVLREISSFLGVAADAATDLEPATRTS